MLTKFLPARDVVGVSDMRGPSSGYTATCVLVVFFGEAVRSFLTRQPRMHPLSGFSQFALFCLSVLDEWTQSHLTKKTKKAAVRCTSST